ncbi:lysM domain-containing protein [Hirsutella rhossiliensis]|uniref:LysM domain-containing protein n=1 Tax=Hirsutella rhossiliensis TaxID=111463 RepID=A0A9P8SDC0_9HYPO|nr:lysM domain-containing protein [Hirsutella rhossiliensis]KAH0958563.1 lysM domain-containing protein [Hirsutella rhossiliensis]
MPSRYSHLDSDDERLPDGMTRVAYDADTQVYTFRDAADGSYWEGAPGCQYGQLTRVSGPSPPPRRSGYNDDDDDDDDDLEDIRDPFLPGSSASAKDPPHISWRHDLMPLLNFGLLVGVSLLLLFWYLHRAAASAEQQQDTPLVPVCAAGDAPVPIHKGDTCWDMAEARGIALEVLLAHNGPIDCDRLVIGSQLCLPE